MRPDSRTKRSTPYNFLETNARLRRGRLLLCPGTPVAGVNHINTEFRTGSMQLPTLFPIRPLYLPLPSPSPYPLSLSLVPPALLDQHPLAPVLPLPVGLTGSLCPRRFRRRARDRPTSSLGAISTTAARTPSGTKGLPSRSFASSKKIVRTLMKKTALSTSAAVSLRQRASAELLFLRRSSARIVSFDAVYRAISRGYAV